MVVLSWIYYKLI